MWLSQQKIGINHFTYFKLTWWFISRKSVWKSRVTADQTKLRVPITSFYNLHYCIFTHIQKKVTAQKIPDKVRFFTCFPPSSFMTFNSKDIHCSPLIWGKVGRIPATVNHESATALWNVMFSIHSKFCINLFVAVFQLIFSPNILLGYRGSVQNSLLLSVVEDKEEGEKSLIKEIINHSILNH